MPFNNDAGGVKLLLAELKNTPHFTAVLFEAIGGLEREAATALCVAGLCVMVVNPRQAHDFAKALDGDIDGALKAHFADKLALLNGLKSVGPGTQAALMAGLPELAGLGQLTHKEIAKIVGWHPSRTTAARCAVSARRGVDEPMCGQRCT